MKCLKDKRFSRISDFKRFQPGKNGMNTGDLLNDDDPIAIQEVSLMFPKNGVLEEHKSNL